MELCNQGLSRQIPFGRIRKYLDANGEIQKHVNESFRELERLGSLIGIEPQNEVGPYVGYITQDRVDMFGNMADFAEGAGTCFCASCG